MEDVLEKLSCVFLERSCEMRMLRYNRSKFYANQRCLEKKKLEWYGYLCLRDTDEDISRVHEMRVEGSRGYGQLKQQWCNTIKADLC